MKLISLDIENFMGIGTAFVKLNRPGVTLIEGSNGDSKTSISNGAGKSTIFESIYYALYGKTKRGLTGDAVINRHNKKAGCRVTIKIEVGKETILIERTRGGKIGTTLKVTHGEDDLSKGTAAATQEMIEELIKINPVVFERIAFVGQGDVKPFASLSDADLKRTFEDAMGLRFISESYEKLKIHKRKLTEDHLMIEKTIELTEREILALHQDIARQDEKIVELAAYHNRLMGDITNSITGLNAEHSDLNELMVQYEAKADESSKVFASAYKDELEKISTDISALKALRVKLDGEFELKNRDKIAAYSVNKTILAKLTECGNAIKAAEKQQKEGCPACKRPFDKDSMEKYITGLGEQYTATREEQAPCEEACKKTIAAETALKNLYPQIDEKVRVLEQEISAIRVKDMAAKKDSEAAGMAAKETAARLGKVQAEIEANKARQADLEAETVKIRGEVEKTKWMKEADLKVRDEAMFKAAASLKEISEKLLIANGLEQTLGNGGVKSYIFDSITPALNLEINKALSVLDPAISCEVSTIKVLKSGDCREKFDIKISNVNGGSTYKANSGGEKSKVDIAIALAFNKICRQMGENIGFMGFDEPFESLDDQSSEAVVDLLSACDVGTLFVISHNSAIKDVVTQRIIVEKKGGSATVKAA